MFLTFDTIKVVDIDPDLTQPRKKRNEQADKELADSVKAHGVLQPILVRKVGNRYIIVFGERRWRAAQTAGLEEMPALITTADSKQISVVQLIENIQREDLSPQDLADHLNELNRVFKSEDADDKKATLRVLASITGKSLGWVSEKLALARLPERVSALKTREENSVKNSRVLIGLARLNDENPEAAASLIKEIEGGKVVTVDLVNEVRGLQRKPKPQKKAKAVLSDLPREAITPKPVPADTVESAKEDDNTQPADNAAPSAEPAKPAKRKKKVSDVAKLIGVPDDLPAEDLLEALADAYAKLLETTAVAA